MANLSDAVARPRVIINTNDIPSEDGNNVIFNKPLPLVDAIEKQPEATVIPEVKAQPETSKVQTILDKLFGLHGEERYQLWPERLVRDAMTAPRDVMTGQIPQYEVDPVSGEVHTGSGMIKAAQDVSALAGTGGLAGVGSEAGIALGSGPILKSAMPEIKPFYSAVENAVAAAKQPKADAQQWLSFLKNQPGVKQEELAHLGLDKLSGSITKDELLKAVQEGQPQIKEVIKGTEKGPFGNAAYDAANSYRQDLVNKYGNGIRNKASKEELDRLDDLEARGEMKNPNPTKYHSYQLPGGENYREMLLTLPRKEITTNDVSQRLFKRDMRNLDENERQAVSDEMRRLFETKEGGTDYQSSHWDEPNVLAHIRMNDRSIDGKKSLHLEEIQSDWHQAGRKSGYSQKLTDAEKKEAASLDSKLGNGEIKEGSKEHERLMQLIAKDSESGSGVPDAPFKKTWDELALKKAITHAVRQSHDSEVANWEKMVHFDTDELAHKLVKSGHLKEICE